MDQKYFPIKTDTACQLKWSWSTIHLNGGVTKSCHRTGVSVLTNENFLDFHNTPLKIKEREDMLNGKWPENSCQYCRNIEESGGVSDRMRHLTIPNVIPEELYEDPTSTKVNPTLVEVYFNNTCNLGCLYCNDNLSSVIDRENKKFGDFEVDMVKLIARKNNFKDLVGSFWKWFDKNFIHIKRMHILGGEPFYQKEFDIFLEKILLTPNPSCELNVVTNLMVSEEKLKSYIDKFKNILKNKYLKRIDITVSIDCWGKDQEYVRWGLDLDLWEKNFNVLLNTKWLTLHINQTITPLTIKTMPKLLTKLIEWRKVRPVGHYFSAGDPIPEYFKLDALGYDIFKNDIEEIMNLMPIDNDEDIIAKDYMSGIFNEIKNSKLSERKLKNLIIFLNEKDRRRKTNWKEVFPWLHEMELRLG